MLLLSSTMLFTGLVRSLCFGVYSAVIGYTKGCEDNSSNNVNRSLRGSYSRLGHNRKSLASLNAVILSVGEVLGSMVFGFLGLKFTLRHGRYPVVLLGCLVSLLTYSLMVINFPSDANNAQETDNVGLMDPPSKVITLAASFLLGFADSCFNTQVFKFMLIFLKSLG